MVRKTQSPGFPKKSPFHDAKLSIGDAFNSDFGQSNQNHSEFLQSPQKQTLATLHLEAEENAAYGLGHRNRENNIAPRKTKLQGLKNFQLELACKLEKKVKIIHRKDFKVNCQDWESHSEIDFGKDILTGIDQPLHMLHHGVTGRGSVCDLFVGCEAMEIKYKKHVEFSKMADTNVLIKQIGKFSSRKSPEVPGSLDLVGNGQIPEIGESEESGLTEKSEIAREEDITHGQNQKSQFGPAVVCRRLTGSRSSKKNTGPRNYNLKSSFTKSILVSEASISTVSKEHRRKIKALIREFLLEHPDARAGNIFLVRKF